jgi:hypothetical protein
VELNIARSMQEHAALSVLACRLSALGKNEALRIPRRTVNALHLCWQVRRLPDLNNPAI